MTVNGGEREIAGEEEIRLVDLLGMLGFGEIPVVVEHNGVALLRGEQAGAVVRDGDGLEIVRVVAGG